MRLPRTFSGLTCLWNRRCFPDLPGHGAISYGGLLEIHALGSHPVGHGALDKAESFTALKRSLDGPSNQGAQVNSLPIHAHPCAFRKGSASFHLSLADLESDILDLCPPQTLILKERKSSKTLPWVSPKSRVPRATQGYRLIPLIWRLGFLSSTYLPSGAALCPQWNWDLCSFRDHLLQGFDFTWDKRFIPLAACGASGFSIN